MYEIWNWTNIIQEWYHTSWMVNKLNILCKKRYLQFLIYHSVNKIFFLTVVFLCFLCCKDMGNIWKLLQQKQNYVTERNRKRCIWNIPDFVCIECAFLSSPTSFIYNTRRTRFTKRLNNLILIHFAHYHRRCDIALPPLSGA